MTGLTHIDLFSGIGGFALAAQWAGFKTVAFVEIDEYCNEIIKQNFRAIANAEGWQRQQYQNGERESRQRRPEFESSGPLLFTDIRDLDGTAYRGATLLTGGFPCQPFSQAGKRRGKEDDRYLWPEMLRVIHEARPNWVLGENVAGIINMELDRVLSDLEGEGYACQSIVIPACAVDAKHRRDRVWIVAHRNGAGQRQRWGAEPVRAPQLAAERSGQTMGNAESFGSESRREHRILGSEAGTGEREAQERERLRDAIDNSGEDVADAASAGQGNDSEGAARNGFTRRDTASGSGIRQSTDSQAARWLPEPDVGGTADGFPRWFYQHYKEGMNYAEVQRAIKTLRNLWNDDVSQALAWATRGLGRMEAAKVLFSFVREYENRGWLSRQQLASKEALEDVLRELRRQGIVSGSSSGQEEREQSSGEYPDSLCSLSRFNASWESGVDRVANGIKHRVDRLKGLGNAIVPQVAYEILEKIARIEMGGKRHGRKRRL